MEFLLAEILTQRDVFCVPLREPQLIFYREEFPTGEKNSAVASRTRVKCRRIDTKNGAQSRQPRAHRLLFGNRRRI
jgi:hypothetical protein